MCLSHTPLIVGQGVLSLINALERQLTIFEMETVSCAGLKLFNLFVLILVSGLCALILLLVHFHYSRACRGPTLY